MITIDDYDTPWEVACKLIDADREVNTICGKRKEPMFERQDIQAIGRHLTCYALTEEEREKDNE